MAGRARATLEDLLDLGTAERRGDLVVVRSRMGEVTEWRRVAGTEWYERVDAAAPVVDVAPAPAPRPVAAPPAFALEVQAAPKAAPPSLAAMLLKLDPDQRSVALDWTPELGRIARALAAAGSGKTHTTIALVGRLIAEGKLRPADVVITTFTRKAAGELVKRLKGALPTGQVPERVGTFHSLALRSLKILDPARWNPKRCTDLGRDAEVPSARAIWRMVFDDGPKSELMGVLGMAGVGLGEDELPAYMAAADVLRSRPLSRAELSKAAGEVPLKYFDEALDLYLRAKEKLGAFDWADALEAWHAALVGGELRADAMLVAVDEAQDCTAIQLEIARLLAQRGTLLLIGDVRQAIYEWRGASPDILATADVKLGATTLQLRRNYRSGRRIVELGNAICEGATWAVGDPAMPVRPEAGEIEFFGDHVDGRAEAAWIAEDIAASGVAERAVLCRTRAGTAMVEAELMVAGIPCAVAGGSSFFETKVAKDSLAFYALAQPGVGTPEDLQRVLRIPEPRFLGHAFVKRVREKGGEVLSALRKVANDPASGLHDGQRNKAHELGDLIQKLRQLGWAALPEQVSSLIAATAVEHDTDERDGSSDVQALAATMSRIAERFASANDLKAFAARCVGEVKGLRDGESDGARVMLSTIHKAKGLEWSQVYVAGLTKGVFPHAKSDTPEREAEERRLFYVAVTRAKDRLVLTWANTNPYGQPAGPSPFAELAKEVVLGTMGEG